MGRKPLREKRHYWTEEKATKEIAREERDRKIMWHYKRGKSFRQIGRLFNLSPARIHKIVWDNLRGQDV